MNAVAPVLIFLSIFLGFRARAAADNLDRGRLFLRSYLSQGRAPGIAGHDFAADRGRNYYLSGYFNQRARFDTNILTSDAPCDAFLAKYDRSTNLLWVRQIHDAQAPAVAVHGTEAVFLAGGIKGDTTAGTNVLHCLGKQDIYLAKYDTAGNLLWIRHAGGPDYEYACGAAVDAAGNCFIAGEFRGPIAFGETQLKPQGHCDMFIAKYDADGRLLWARRDSGRFTEPRGAAVDTTGNLFVTGVYFGQVSFSGTSLPVVGGNMFLAKYDPDGRLLWASAPGGPRGRTGHQVGVDRYGNPHVVGGIQGTRQFGDIILTNDRPAHDNVFIAKYGADGDFQWVRQFHNGDFEFSNTVDVEESGVNLPASSVAKKAGGTPPSGRAETASVIKRVLYSVSPAPASAAGLRSPELALAKSGEFIVLFWSNDFANWTLEATDTFAPFPIWESVSSQAEPFGGQVAVAIPITGTAKFYRLRKP